MKAPKIYFKTSVTERLKDPVTPETLADLLTFLGEDGLPTAEEIAKWTPLDRAIVEDYVCRVHLAASDNLYVRIPQRPNLLGAPRPASIAKLIDAVSTKGSQ